MQLLANATYLRYTITMPFARTLMLVLLTTSFDTAQQLYARGNYPEAAKLAAAQNTNPGFTLSARAFNALGEQNKNQKEEHLEAALGYANQAIQLDANQSDAYVERARATGHLAELHGILGALSDGSAQKIKTDLDKALAINPKQPAALAGLAAWHAEISSRNAGWLFKADSKVVQPLCQQATQLTSNPSVFLSCARAFIQLKQFELAKNYLQTALKQKPQDATERFAILESQQEIDKL